MFNFFKKKVVENVKPRIFHCHMCKGNYYREDIDFLESRKLSKIICIKCAEYIKGNLNKIEEHVHTMKNLETIIKNRDALKKSIDNIWTEIFTVKNGREKWSDLPKEDQVVLGKLYSLKDRYYNQLIALDFVLNEHNRLADYRTDRNYEGFVDERFFANLT